MEEAPKKTDLIVPITANRVESAFGVFDFFVEVFVHMRFEHSIAVKGRVGLE
jgi:hypothetical protein